MNRQDFEFLQSYVYQQAGIVLSDDKQYLVDSRMKPILRDFELPDISALVARLAGVGQQDLRTSVINALTTNETSFMRDEAPFMTLRNDILPALIRQRRDKRQLNIWSAACSSGQEAYSLLMIMAEYFQELSNWNLRFVCTDISTEMVERTRAGVYSNLEVNRGLAQTYARRYMNETDQGWQVIDELRQRLEVRQMNLLERWSLLPQFDLILMRNVLIYFDPATKQDLLERAAQHLQPDGTLFLGSSETTLGITNAYDVKTLGKTRYYTLTQD